MNEQKELEVSPQRSGTSVRWIMLGVIALVVVCGFVVALSGSSPSLVWEGIFNSSTNSSSANKTPAPSADSFSPAAGARVYQGGKYVTYVYFTGSEFLPDHVTINSGEGVKFVDVSNLSMRVGSQPENLSSTFYAELSDSKTESEGKSFSIILSQPGIWSYENLSSSEPLVLGVVYVR